MKIILQESDLAYERILDFHERIMEVIATTDSDLVLDFSNVSFTLDSAVIGELMKFHNNLQEQDRRLILENTNKLTRTVFRLNKLDTILHLSP
ncbi:STAS domain-containing protein [Leptospira ryugenii]|nr:STAS domain-containing protein [Leptospira ryugenii]